METEILTVQQPQFQHSQFLLLDLMGVLKTHKFLPCKLDIQVLRVDLDLDLWALHP